MTRPRIEDHGTIGNLHTAAPLGSGGTFPRLCLARSGSPSIFAAIHLDRASGAG